MPARSISFSGPMIRALLEGRKTQSRRVLTRLRRFGPISEFGRSDTKGYDWHFRDREARWHDLRATELMKVLPYAVGDRLWVKERLSRWVSGDLRYAGYFADDRKTFQPWPAHWSRDWAPPMFMPRAFSRFTLVVTGVRVERVANIGWDDAVAEGLVRLKSGRWVAAPGHQYFGRASLDPRITYSWLWDDLNADREGGKLAWAANPFVMVISFDVHHANIDAMEAA